MNTHCKGCKHHHIARRGSTGWCCKYSAKARKIIGHCVLNSGKEEK